MFVKEVIGLIASSEGNGTYMYVFMCMLLMRNTGKLGDTHNGYVLNQIYPKGIHQFSSRCMD